MPYGYCLRCKKTMPLIAAEFVILKNGISATRGKCAICKVQVWKIETEPYDHAEAVKVLGEEYFWG